MKKILATVLGVATMSVAFGQGTIATVSNNSGGTIFPILDSTGAAIVAANANIKVEVFTYGTEASPFGTQLGGVATIGAKGRFNAGSNVTVPGTTPGGTVNLIVRAWDSTTGATYADATVKGNSGSFKSDILGGDPDGDGPLLPITAKTIASGAADGFKSFQLTATVIPEPTTIALGALGAAALFIRRRK
jgi:hypothetical protein